MGATLVHGPPRPTTTSSYLTSHFGPLLPWSLSALLNHCDLLPSYLDWTLEQQAGGGGPDLTVVTAPLTAGSALLSPGHSTLHITPLPFYLPRQGRPNKLLVEKYIFFPNIRDTNLRSFVPEP